MNDLLNTLPETLSVARVLGVETLLFDNASQDETVDFARDLDGVHVEAGERNGGFAHGVNRLFAQAGDRDVLLLNPDVSLDAPAAVERLVDHLRDPAVGLVAPRLVNPDGSAQLSARQFPTFVGMAGRSSAAQRVPAARRAAEAYVRPPESDRASDVDWAIGGALLVRNATYREVGPWDEGFFLYLEDVDFCLRAARAGWRTRFDPSISLVHTHHRASDPSRGGAWRSPARRHHIRSTLRFFAKHRSLAPSA